MERRLQVATGEFVEVEYELAGIGTRFLAVMIDFVVQIGLVVGLGILGLILDFALFGGALPKTHFDKQIQSFESAILLFIAWLIFFGYFILFGIIAKGTTPGKRMMHIRVVRNGGFPVDPLTVVIREILRLAEAALLFYFVAGIVMLCSAQNKSLADLAAGTIVIVEA